jgi:hypothetical protein
LVTAGRQAEKLTPKYVYYRTNQQYDSKNKNAYDDIGGLPT